MCLQQNRRCYPAVLLLCAPTEIRTLVLALKGLRPGPLDDGGSGLERGVHCTITSRVGQGKIGLSLVKTFVLCYSWGQILSYGWLANAHFND